MQVVGFSDLSFWLCFCFFLEGFRVGLFFQGPKGKKTQDLGVRKIHRWNQSPNKAVVGPRGIIANCRFYPIHSGRL